jgi:formate hydrogenlyase subunit 3/multisubunit Na+/H+ antiporter MnhD subunit
MSAPLLLLAGTGLLAAIAAAGKGHSMWSPLVSALGAGLLGAFALMVSVDLPFNIIGMPIKLTRTMVILGRTLTLADDIRAEIGFLYISSAFLFAGGWPAKAHRYLYPAGLLCLGLVAASLLVRPFVFAAIFLELAAIMCFLILATPEYPAWRGGLRLLSVYTLAMLAILLTGWMLEIAGIAGGATSLTSKATLLLGLGFAVLMAVPPFHLWLPPAADKAHPYGMAFVALVLQSAGLFFMLRFLDTYPWLRGNPGLYQAIRDAALIMIVLGGSLAVAQQTMTRMMAYSLVADFGVALLAVASGVPDGYQLALGITGARVVGLSVWALGLSVIWNRTDAQHGVIGAARRMPEAALAALIGAASLAGLPLTAGFPGRWGLLSILAPSDLMASLGVGLGILLLGGATLRWARKMLDGGESPERRPRPLGERLFLISGAGLCLLLGLFPQAMYPWIVRVAAGLSNLVP